MVGPDFGVVGSDSAAELAGEVAPLQPQFHPLQLVPQRAHAPRIVTQHTQNLPALPLSVITTLPAYSHILPLSILRTVSLSILKILPLSIAHAVSISILRVCLHCGPHTPNSLHLHSDTYEIPNTATPILPAMLHTCSKGP